MTPAIQRAARVRLLIACTAAYCVANATWWVQPILIAQLVAERGYSGSAAGLVVTAEIIGGSGGLGDSILSAQRTFLVKESYAWLVMLALLGLLLTWFFTLVERRLAFWNAPQAQ